MKIYKITNLLNGKMYVGQTKTTLSRRFTSHVVAANSGEKCIIHNAIRKYGKDNFKIELLEECSSEQELDTAERKWIKELNSLAPSGYNIEEGGCRNRGSLSEATRAKLRLAAKNRGPEWYARICHAAKNRGESWKQKLREAAKNRKPPTAAQLASLELGRRKDVWRPPVDGENNPRAILTWETVQEIRTLYATGNYSQEKLGSLFGVKQVTISAIVCNRSWKINSQQG